jgi:3-oxoacyl-[acyl-carrier protein] reductase
MAEPLERSPSLEGRVALITGAGRGIGEAIALEFGRLGARLVVASRTESQLLDLAERCRDLGSRCEVCATDVSRPGHVERLAAFCRTRFGRIDVVVNAAAVLGPIGPFVETDPDDWEATLRTNLVGTVNVCRTALSDMVSARTGTIINLSGGGATSPLPNLSAYAVSKAAVVRFTETLAQEVARFGIRVYAIAPGLVDTTIHDQVVNAGERAGPQYWRSSELRSGAGSGIKPATVAQLTAFLASDRPPELSGRLISAAHDPWQTWRVSGVDSLKGTPWYTLRRVDPHTLRGLERVDT